MLSEVMMSVLLMRAVPRCAWDACTPSSAGSTRLVCRLYACLPLPCPPPCSYLLVVEKDAVFQRLAEDRAWSSLPLVLITARGMPDLATRALAAKLVVRAHVLSVHRVRAILPCQP